MPFTRAGQLARFVVASRPDDPIGLVAENLRFSPHGVLPVLDRPTFGEGDPGEREAYILGLITARDLGKVARLARNDAITPLDTYGLPGQKGRQAGSSHPAPSSSPAPSTPAPAPAPAAAETFHGNAAATTTVAAPAATSGAKGAEQNGGVTEQDWSLYAPPEDAETLAAQFAEARTSAPIEVRTPAPVTPPAAEPAAQPASSPAPAAVPDDAAAPPLPTPEGSEEENTGPITLGHLQAQHLMNTDVPFVPSGFSLENTLNLLDRYGMDALPVVDEQGKYRGLVARADVIAALAGTVRPQVVGGMATPLGVFLTDGRVRGGAPPLGLFLSGCMIAFCYVIADFLPSFVLSQFNSDLARWWSSATVPPDGSYVWFFHMLAVLAHGMLFLGAFRMLPISGTHAAEHQVVWAMEKGLPLTPEYVSKMPRAHPRCGTNLAVLSGLILVAVDHLPDVSSANMLLVLVFAFFFWRGVGTWIQENFTTREPSAAQLESGIKAANELLENYQAQPFAASPMPLRLLNSGMVPSAAGMVLTLLLMEALRNYAAVLIVQRTGG